MGSVTDLRPLPHRRNMLIWAAALLASPAVAAGKAPSARPVVTILGDSITAGLGLSSAEALPAQLEAALKKLGLEAEVRGAGVSGDTTAGALARTEFSVQPDTAVCVVELGGNDFLQSVPPAETEANLRAIIGKLQKRGAVVVLASAKLPGARNTGSYGRDFEALFPSVAKATGARLTPDLLGKVLSDPAMKQRDGLHPNAVGARLLAEALAPTVAKALKARRKR